MSELSERFAAVKAEVHEIQDIIKDNPSLPIRVKNYLIERACELAVECGNIALAKMERGDKV